MTKADLVESIYEKIGFSKKEATDLVEMVFNMIKDTLSKSDKKIAGVCAGFARYFGMDVTLMRILWSVMVSNDCPEIRCPLYRTDYELSTSRPAAIDEDGA